MAQVSSRFPAGAATRVIDVQQRSLNCTALGLQDPAFMTALSFSFKDTEYTATKLGGGSVQMADHDSLYTWVGSIDEGSATVTVVWDDACSASKFLLEVAFDPADAPAFSTLTTVPCGAAESTAGSNCIWTAAVQVPEKTALEPHPVTVGGSTRHLRGSHRKSQTGTPDSGNVIDVLWLYSNTTLARYGHDAIVSKIAGGVATANTALNNSKAGFTLRAVAVVHVNYTGGNLVQVWTDMNNGNVPGAAALRDQYKADVVQVVTEGTGYCGYGSLMYSASASFAPFANSVVDSDCIATYSHLHEILHNMGAQHNPENAHAGATMWPYGFGNRVCAADAAAAPYFRTIMSYPCKKARRVLYVSTSDSSITYQGTAVGSAEKDNVRVVQETRHTVANFRQGGN